MKWIEDKKVLGCIALLVIVFFISLVTYGKDKDKVFKDEYMGNIFVEDEGENIDLDLDNSKAVIQQSNLNSDLNSSNIIVEIKGAVKKPDVYTLQEGSIVKDLIDKAGGLNDDANISNINRAKKLQNHELVIVYTNDEVETSPSINTVDNKESLININTATIEELKKISGIGDIKAQSIIDYRDKNGGFKNIDEIKNIDGIGDKTFEKIKSQITL